MSETQEGVEAGEQPGAERPAVDQPAEARTDAAQPAVEQTAAAQPDAPRPSSGEPTAEEPDAADPAAAPADAGQPGEPQPKARRGAKAVSDQELQALQAAEEAKGDPALDEVAPADIEVSDDKEDSFDKLVASAKRLSPERVRTVVETLLFLAERPLTVEELRQTSGVEVDRLEKALDKLSGHYREGPCGIVLHEVAGGWQLRSSPDNSAFARRFLKVKPQRLTRAALETLAIIAYRQPVTRPEVEEIRSVDSGAVVKALLERRLIKILGKKEEPGRPILYGTTKEFLEFFALKDLASLPTLREFHELSVEHRDILEKQSEPPLVGLVEQLADPTLAAQLEAGKAASDAALDELERAMARADTVTGAAAAALKPPPAEGDEVQAAPPAPGAALGGGGTP
jgi:segregation and condensation protein B